MAFLDNRNPPDVVSTVVNLRLVDTTSLTADSIVYVSYTNPSAVMRYNPQRLDAESEADGIIIPNDKDAATPGRWIFDRWA